jgi:hypothetical protein
MTFQTAITLDTKKLNDALARFPPACGAATSTPLSEFGAASGPALASSGATRSKITPRKRHFMSIPARERPDGA